MSANGIRDKVAIVGMGCTPFGERWDKGADDLLIDAAKEAIASAGVGLDDLDAFWLGTMASGRVRAHPVQAPEDRLQAGDPRLENFCATGSEAFRNACYAVASGAYDLVMAIGVEKLKDSGYSGLTGIRPVGRRDRRRPLVPGRLLLPGPGVRRAVRGRPRGDEAGDEPDRLEEPPATVRSTPGPSSARRSPWRPSPSRRWSPGDLGVYDCSGVSDGSAAAIICRAEDAHRYTDHPLYVKALSFVAGPGGGADRPRLRLHHLPRGGALGRGRLPAGRDHRPPGVAGHGRGPRLLHPDRARADGGHGLLRAGARMEGRAGRDVRPGRRAAGQSRRRASRASATRSGRRGSACCSSAGSSSGGEAPPERQIATVAEGRILGPDPQSGRGARGSA